MKKIEDSPLKNQADGQPIYELIHALGYDQMNNHPDRLYYLE